MKSKEEIIKEAYDEIGIIQMCNNEYLKSQGWSKNNEQFRSQKNYNESNLKTHKFGKLVRPRSLKVIEYNNGWIKIESEKDLPKESGHYYITDIDGDMHMSFYSTKYKDFSEVFLEYTTHYRPIVKPKPPLY